MLFMSADHDPDPGKCLFERLFVFFLERAKSFHAIGKMDRIHPEFGQRTDPSDQLVRAGKRGAAGAVYDAGQGELFTLGIRGECSFSLSEVREAAHRRATEVLGGVGTGQYADLCHMTYS